MPNVTRSALVPFSAESMFDLVNDIEAYPNFLPGCTDAKIVSVTSTGMRASLSVAKAGVGQSFTTENKTKRGEFIDMKLIEGPFKTLEGGWTFTPLAEDACKIELKLQFEFSNKLVQMAFGKVFESLANSMVQAFTEQAKVVYRK